MNGANPSLSEEEALMSTLAIENASRRDFLYVATLAVGASGVAAIAWPLIDQMNPDRSTMAMAAIEVDLGKRDLMAASGYAAIA